MLNFRKLKQDYSSSILKDGKALYEKNMVSSAKIVTLDAQSVRLNCTVQGAFEKSYHCEIEIDRRESTTIDSDCDCPYKYDCQHLSAVLFYLEEHLSKIILDYSKESDFKETVDESEKETLIETFKEAETQEYARKSKKLHKELLHEYVGASSILGTSPFFLPEEEIEQGSVSEALLGFTPSAPPGETLH